MYDTIARQTQNTVDAVKVRNPLRYYFNYGRYLVFAQGPKLSYVNNFEPEYTKKTVRYNAPIVLGMFAVTFILAEIARKNKKEE